MASPDWFATQRSESGEKQRVLAWHRLLAMDTLNVGMNITIQFIAMKSRIWQICPSL
jgi:hypothetical protein